MAVVDAPRRKDGFGRQTPLPAPKGSSWRAAASRAAIAFAAVFGLAACSTSPMHEAVIMRQGPVIMPAPPTNTELRALLSGPRTLVVAGDRLNAGLLRRFYARHGFEPVWAARRPQANLLMAAVLRARDQGLDPELFHAAKLRRDADLPPLERDLLLSDAFLTYADALARGAVPVERRRDDEVLTPEPVDVAAVLDDATRGDDPAGVIEALAPATPAYRALLQALQTYRAMPYRPTSYRVAHHAGPRARRRPAFDFVRTIEVNLERLRWLPRRLPADRAWVNIADERLVLYRAGQPVFSTRVVVGEDIQKNQSPEFRATIDASFYNPPWVIPSDIAKAEILPKLDRDPDYLKRNKMVLLASGDVEQLPGPEAGLGLIMFDMPNRFDVYLHDTPDREIFSRENRRLSHGCIRVQNPQEFAALLTDQPVGVIDEGIATGRTTRNDLQTPVPVFVVYQTAFADPAGTVQFRPDFYKRDAAIWQMLQEKPQGRVLAVQADHQPDSPDPL